MKQLLLIAVLIAGCSVPVTTIRTPDNYVIAHGSWSTLYDRKDHLEFDSLAGVRVNVNNEGKVNEKTVSRLIDWAGLSLLITRTFNGIRDVFHQVPWSDWLSSGGTTDE